MAVHRKAVALMDPIEAVARLSERAGERAESAQTRASGSASFDNADGTRTVIGPQTGSATMATHVGDVTPPGRPLGVAGASSAGVVYVAWGGELDGGIPADFDRVSVYMSVEGVSELVGTLTEAGIVSTVPMATTATVEVWATAEDDCCLADGTPAHNVSEESDHATVAVTQGEDAAAVDALRERVSAVEAKADGLSTLIREDSTGITVGKSADGKTYSTGRTRMTDSAFQVLDKAGNVLSSFGEKLIELSKNSMNATISMFGGLATIAAQKFGVFSGIEISANGIGLQATSGGMNIHSHFLSTGRGGVGQVDVSTNLVSEEPMLSVWVSDTTDAAEYGVSIGVTPFGVTTNHPEYMRSALGLEFKRLYYDYDAGWVVYASDYLVWIYAWGVYIGSGSWDSKKCPYVLPAKYRPKLSHITTPAVTTNGHSCTSVLVVKSDGTINVSNRGGSGSDDSRYGVLFYPVGV